MGRRCSKISPSENHRDTASVKYADQISRASSVRRETEDFGGRVSAPSGHEASVPDDTLDSPKEIGHMGRTAAVGEQQFRNHALPFDSLAEGPFAGHLEMPWRA
jgi:hypothetical protein